jgi:hypothetical protein
MAYYILHRLFGVDRERARCVMVVQSGAAMDACQQRPAGEVEQRGIKIDETLQL